MVAMCMCFHDVASAAIADAMAVVYETTDLDPASPVAVRLTNTLYMETVIALQDMDKEEEDGNGQD